MSHEPKYITVGESSALQIGEVAFLDARNVVIARFRGEIFCEHAIPPNAAMMVMHPADYGAWEQWAIRMGFAKRIH